MGINDFFDINGIMTGVTTSVITDVGSTGWSKVKKFFKDSQSKNAIDYGQAYSNYLMNTYDRNSKIKTLIYRRTPKDLHSFYECVCVQNKDSVLDTSNIKNLLEVSNKLIISGIGGIGKSMLLRYLFLNTIQNTENIPVLIELRKLNNIEIKEISLYQLIYQNLVSNGFKLEDEYYSYSLEKGGYIIFLDGFDELNREKTDILSEEIQNFSGKYNLNKFIVSSRPSDNFIGWNDFYELTVCPLTKEQALSLIKKIEFEEIAKNAFYKALDDKLFDKYKSFATNPLLLTIMLLTFSNHASIPDNLNDFYEEAFATLFNKHDATKDCYVRDIRSNLGYEDFKIIFSYICFKSFFKNEFEFSESGIRKYIQQAKERFNDIFFTIDSFQEDLTSSVCMLIKEGINYRFTHRSFQEYFAALYTCKLMDEQQSAILAKWLSERYRLRDGYIRMLFELQKDKVNKIIFCPGIKKLKNLYEEKGFSYDLLRTLFLGISIEQPIKKNKQGRYYDTRLYVKDNYLGNILAHTYSLNKYSPSVSNENHLLIQQNLQEISKVIGDILFFDSESVLFNSNQLLFCLEDINMCMNFCFDLYAKYSKNLALEDQTLSSIIDEL